MTDLGLSTDDFDIQLRNNDFTQGGLADKHVQDFNLEEMYDGCNEEIEQVIWNYRELASDVYKADKPAEFVEPNKLFRSILGLKSVDIPWGIIEPVLRHRCHH